MTLIRLTYFSENHLNGRGGELLAGVREIIKKTRRPTTRANR